VKPQEILVNMACTRLKSVLPTMKGEKDLKKILQTFKNGVRSLVFSIYAKQQLLEKVGIDRKRKCEIIELSRLRQPITM